MQEKPSRALLERLGEDFFLDFPSHRTHRDQISNEKVGQYLAIGCLVKCGTKST